MPPHGKWHPQATLLIRRSAARAGGERPSRITQTSLLGFSCSRRKGDGGMQTGCMPTTAIYPAPKQPLVLPLTYSCVNKIKVTSLQLMQGAAETARAAQAASHHLGDCGVRATSSHILTASITNLQSSSLCKSVSRF